MRRGTSCTEPAACKCRFHRRRPPRTRNGQFAARCSQTSMPAKALRGAQNVHTARERDNLGTNACANFVSRRSLQKPQNGHDARELSDLAPVCLQTLRAGKAIQKAQNVHDARERDTLCTNACANFVSRPGHAKVSKRARRTRTERFGT